MRFYITVLNSNLYSTEWIDFQSGVYAFCNSHPNGKKGGVVANGNYFNNRLHIIPDKPATFCVSFVSSIFEDHEKIKISNDNFALDEIVLPFFYPTSLTQVNEEMETWDNFYNERRKVKVSFASLKDVQAAILRQIEEWQHKGEFETTAQWQMRVNDMSRKQYADSIAQKYSKLHKQEISIVKEEQQQIALEYQEYKKKILDDFYKRRSQYAISQFNATTCELRPYDADNQTFLIHCGQFGDILLPVPLTEAPTFKNNWAFISRTIEPEFVPSGEDVSLSRLVFKNDGKQYVYDSHTVANYAITDINYNFAPIEIAELDFSNLDLYSPSNLPVEVSSSLVAINNTTNLSKRTVKAERRQINASQKSDIDTSIPESKSSKSSNTFAVIIANEQYDNVASVPYAENDGKILSKYLIQTVGLPTEHVKVFRNATYGNMALALKHVADLSAAYGDKLNLIFYYAGHGTPNERTKQSMLLPVDGVASMPETCFDVDKLYNSLAALNANSVVVLMDACFSGSLRGDGMLMAARGVKIKSNLSEPKGNMVVISASQGDETAYPYEKEQHGLFTYFLLKKLQETRGNVTLGELSSYIVENVKKQSIVANGKLQTPSVQVSPAISQQWKSWQLSQ